MQRIQDLGILHAKKEGDFNHKKIVECCFKTTFSHGVRSHGQHLLSGMGSAVSGVT